MLSCATLVVLLAVLSPALSLDLNVFLQKDVYDKCMKLACSDLEPFLKQEDACFAKLSEKDLGFIDEQLVKKCYGKSPEETRYAATSRICKDSGKYFGCHSEFLTGFIALERNEQEKKKYDDTLECLTPLYSKCL